MQQILHIFRKDIRRHWPDILVALAILATYVWDQPAEWHPPDLRSQILHQMLREYLPFIVMLAWALLIARVLLTEPLVGDRQFWVTRPYQWHKLLIAKSLLVVMFVNLPLLAAQVFLLSKAGFSPAAHIPDLLMIQGWWVILLILPVATLATLSANLAQFLLTVLGILVSAIGMAILSSRLQYAGSIPAQWLPEWIAPVLLLTAAITVVFLQYARRKTLHSRLILISAVTAALILSAVRKQPGFSLQPYPVSSSGEQAPVQVNFTPSKIEQQVYYVEKNKVPVRIPLLFSGVPENGAASVDGVKIEIEAGGMHWNSGWFRTFWPFLPTQTDVEFPFSVDKSFFERVKTNPATVHISLALTGFRAREAQRITSPPGDFAVPGEAICSMWPQEMRGLHCRAPVRMPFLLLAVLPPESTCPRDEKDQADNRALFGAQWSPQRPVGPALSPVQIFDLSLWQRSRNRMDKGPPQVLCPGTPLNFQILHEAQRARSELTIEGIRLADYQPKQASQGFGIVSVAR